MCITNSPAPSRINSAELPQRDVTVWEFAIFGYFPCIIWTVRTRSFNQHKHRKMAIFCYFFSRFFVPCIGNFLIQIGKKNILFGIGNTTEYRSSKRAKKNPGHCEHGQPMEQTRSLFCTCSSGVACCQSQHQGHFWRINSIFEAKCTGKLAWQLSIKIWVVHEAMHSCKILKIH